MSEAERLSGTGEREVATGEVAAGEVTAGGPAAGEVASGGPTGEAGERLGTAEVARRLGVKRETVYAYVSRGLLARHPASGPHDSRFDPAEVERLAARARRPDRSSALEVVVETKLTLLDPAGRLSYRGRDAIELARFRSFEEVVALLWDGAPPTPWELDEESAAAIATLGDALGGPVLDRERGAEGKRGEGRPGAEHMEATPDAERIAAVVATLAARDPERDGRDPDSVRRAGAEVFAGTLAALERGRPLARPDERGRPKARPAGQRTTTVGATGQRTTAGVAERLWGALAGGGARARPGQVAALDAALVLLADHELAASTFAARVAASAWAGPYRVILAGLGPLGGALHGGAGVAVEALLDEVAAGADPAAALDARAAAGPVPGFGHRVYRDRDPRADHLLARLGLDLPARAPRGGRPASAMGLSKSTAMAGSERRSAARDGAVGLDAAGTVGLDGAGALLDAAAERGLPAPNVDFALAALVKAHGLRPGSAATIFTVARIAGIVAHALEEYEHRLRFRPRASYVGPLPPPSGPAG